MRKFVILFILLAAAVVAWLYGQHMRPSPFVVSGFVEADQIRVGSRVGGRIETVYVEEGDRAKIGQPLYQLGPFDLRDKLARAQAEVAAAKAEHERLSSGYRVEEVEEARARRELAAATLERWLHGPRAQEIEIVRQQLSEARANLEWAQAEYERLKQLREEDVAAVRELRETSRYLKTSQAAVIAAEQRLSLAEEGTRKEEIAEAKAQLAAAEQILKRLEAGYRKEEIAAAAARVAAAQADVAALQVQWGELVVASPCDCIVEAIDLRPGDLVPPDAPSVALLDLSRLWVRAYVPENRIGQVRIGDAVPIRVDSFPDRRMLGRVSFLASEAEFTPQNVQTPEERSKQVFRIKVTVEERAADLRVGMWADILFDEASRP